MSLIQKPTNIIDGYKPVVSGYKQIYISLTSGLEDIYVNNLLITSSAITCSDSFSTRALWFNETLSSASGEWSDGYHMRYIYSQEKYKDPNYMITLDSQLDPLAASNEPWTDRWLTSQISISGSMSPSISGIMHATDYTGDWSDHGHNTEAYMGVSAQIYGLDKNSVASGCLVIHSTSAENDFGNSDELTVYNVDYSASSCSVSGLIYVTQKGRYTSGDFIIWKLRCTESFGGGTEESVSAWFEYGNASSFDLSASADTVDGTRSSQVVSITSSQYVQSQLVDEDTYEWNVISEVYTIE
jgi:hypothetical protein